MLHSGSASSSPKSSLIVPLAATALLQHKQDISWPEAVKIWEQGEGHFSGSDESQRDAGKKQDEIAAELDANEMQVDAEEPYRALEQPDDDDEVQDEDISSPNSASEGDEDLAEISDEEFTVGCEAGDEAGDRRSGSKQSGTERIGQLTSKDQERYNVTKPALFEAVQQPETNYIFEATKADRDQGLPEPQLGLADPAVIEAYIEEELKLGRSRGPYTRLR
ncbi:hypothetical protein V8E36_003707 [Tilletia maclaganii]